MSAIIQSMQLEKIWNFECLKKDTTLQKWNLFFCQVLP